MATATYRNAAAADYERSLREEQAGFRSGRSCSEQILTLRNVIEQSMEFNQKLFINFATLSTSRKLSIVYTEKQFGI